MRVIRGGSWYTDDPWDLDAADRQRVVPDFWDDDIGFRCAKNAR
jgi:formylglycine-generating enzyme required for sulfatase activity